MISGQCFAIKTLTQIYCYPLPEKYMNFRPEFILNNHP